MNLAEFDLNLLVIFDAIYKEKNLTRAGQRLNLSQPAISHALNRLRSAFDDPLFVRHGYRMEPTPLTEELKENIKKVLELTERTLEDRGPFDPYRSTRTFHIGMQDYPMMVVLPKLLKSIKDQAPNIRIRTFHLTIENRKTALEDGKLDMVIGVRQDFGSSIFQQYLFRDREVCIVRQDHPTVKEELSLEDYLDSEFVGLSFSDVKQARIDRKLKEMGHKRKVRLTVENEVTIPQLVSQSDFLANIAELVAKEYVSWLPIKMLQLPIEIEDFEFYQYWHARHQKDPGHSWLRKLIKQTIQND
ncbi:MAG: LysR family transcriptional regulator [Proteobacteria bacterium]|nr:LysR family transcriptional regulator [Pseudomonadota bacterium]